MLVRCLELPAVGCDLAQGRTRTRWSLSSCGCAVGTVPAVRAPSSRCAGAIPLMSPADLPTRHLTDARLWGRRRDFPRPLGTTTFRRLVWAYSHSLGL